MSFPVLIPLPDALIMASSKPKMLENVKTSLEVFVLFRDRKRNKYRIFDQSGIMDFRCGVFRWGVVARTPPWTLPADRGRDQDSINATV